jgi:predicted transcriptional regulator
MIRRSKLEVFGDIMKVIADEGEIRRTRIMYRANLAWKVLKAALDVMESKGVIKTEEKPSGVFVSLTTEGYGALRRFNEVESMFVPTLRAGPGPLIATNRVSSIPSF